MSFIAVIEGIGGDQFYIPPHDGLTTAREKAKRFRSEVQAREAIAAKVSAYQPVIQRLTKSRVEAA